MYYFNGSPINNPLVYQNESFWDGRDWYKVYNDETTCRREAEMLTIANGCEGGVVRITGSGYGVLEERHDDGSVIERYAIKEEYVQGERFDDYVGYNYDEERAIHLFISLLQTLSVLLERGIIHNDLKPENIIVRDNGRPVLIDLGISKKTDPNDPLQEYHTNISEHFSAPEKELKGPSPVSVRGDIFSIGRLMKYLMDHNPEKGENAYSKTFINIRKKCTARNPAERYASFDEVRGQLERIIKEKKEQVHVVYKGEKKKRMLGDAIMRLLAGVSMVLLSLAVYFIFRPPEKEPRRTNPQKPSVIEDCRIIYADVRNAIKK